MSIFSVVIFLFVSSALASSPAKPPTGCQISASGEENICPLESLNLRRETSYGSTESSDEDNSPAKRPQTPLNTLLGRTFGKLKLIDSVYGFPHLSDDFSLINSELESSLGTGSDIASTPAGSEVGQEYDFNAQSLLDFDVGHLESPERRALTSYCKENNKLQKEAGKTAKKGLEKHSKIQ